MKSSKDALKIHQCYPYINLSEALDLEFADFIQHTLFKEIRKDEPLNKPSK